MNKKATLLILGVLSLLSGIVLFSLMIIYSLTQNNDQDYFFILCFAIIFLGIYLLVRAAKLKTIASQKT